MAMRDVHAVFDDGANRSNASRILIGVDGTVGDAVDAFNRHHARDLWRVPLVELVGVVSPEERDDRDAPVFLVSPSSLLRNILRPTDVLVLQSCNVSQKADTVTSGARNQRETKHASRPVLAVFDDGNNTRGTPSRVLVPEDGSISDAIAAFNRNHPMDLWQVEQVKLKGIAVSWNDANVAEANVFDVPITSPLCETLRSNEYLVLEAADPHPQRHVSAIATCPVKVESTTSGRSRTRPNVTPPHVVMRTSQWKHPKPQRDSVPSRRPQQCTSAIMPNQVMRTSQRKPPKPKHDTGPSRLSQRQRRAATISVSSVAAVSPNPRRTDATSSTRDRFGIGSRHFYEWTDKCEYPVRVKSYCRSPNERMVIFEGYGSPKQPVETCDLLPVTPEREKAFQEAKEKTRELDERKRERKELLERERKRKRQENQKIRENRKRQKAMDAEIRRREEERKEFGPLTSIKRPFPNPVRPGFCFEQETSARRVYFALDDETPSDIARQFGVRVGKIVYDNRRLYGGLRENSPLQHGTAVVLPYESEW